MVTIRDVHEVLLNFEKRAENKPDEIISQTFVDAAPLVEVICAPLNQIMFGRRGTGKTHALRFSLAKARENGETAVYLDLRSIGSNTSFYSDEGVALYERGLSVVTDILAALHDELLQLAVSRISAALNPEQITIRLDDLATAISEVRLSGSPKIEEVSKKKSEIDADCGLNASVAATGADAGLSFHHATRRSEETETKISHDGFVRSIDFGRVQVALSGLLSILGVNPHSPSKSLISLS